MGIEDQNSWLTRTYHALPRTPLHRWPRSTILVVLVLPAVVVTLMVVLVALDRSSAVPRASAGDVVSQLQQAGLGCDDAHANPEPEGGVDDSVVCTLATGSELTIDAFRDEDDLRAFEQRSTQYACQFYPEAVGEDDDGESLDGFPYLEGRWWTAVLSIEFNDAGSPRMETERYESLARATQSAVVLVDC